MKILIILLNLGGSALALSALCLPFVTPALRRVCLPFVPATDNQISNVFNAIRNFNKNNNSKFISKFNNKFDKSDKVVRLVDLGSGDGRIVLEASRQGFDALGLELNRWLVLYSQISAWQKGLNCKFVRADLFKFDCSKFNVIVVFGVEAMMLELEQKLSKELDADSIVVACRFSMPNAKPSLIEGQGVDTVWLYKDLAKTQVN